MSIYKNPEVIRRIRLGIEARYAAYNFDYACMLPGCNNIAINSHIVQRSQFLDPISDKYQKLYTIETAERFPGKLPKFKKVPIRNILTFKGFCSTHDHQIFNEIESQPFDLVNDKHLALFLYRGICHELRKKEIIIRWHNGLLKNTSDFTTDQLAKAKHQLDLQNLAIADINFYKSKIEDDIIKGTSNFRYVVERLEYREVVTSGGLNIDNLLLENPDVQFEEQWRNDPLKTLFITTFPMNQELIVIIGNLKTHSTEVDAFISKYGGLSLKFINRLLLEFAETWACSESFYLEYISHQVEEVQIACGEMNVTIPTGIVSIPNIMSK